jgi:hypothetical protein
MFLEFLSLVGDKQMAASYVKKNCNEDIWSSKQATNIISTVGNLIMLDYIMSAEK